MKKPSVRFLSNPRFRHGFGAVWITVFFLTICILLNIAVSSLEDQFGWWTDLSFNSYATNSETTKEALSVLNQDVELYLLYQSGDIDESLHQVLKSYAVLNSHLQVRLTDIAQNPGILTRFEGTSTTDIAADTIIVNCPATGRYQVLGYNDFMTAGYDTESGSYVLEGLAYEKKLTQAIVNVSMAATPVAGILQGHAELTEEVLATFTEELESSSFEVLFLNLLSGDSLENVDLLVIASPQNDFTDGEIDMIAEYAKEGGSFFITKDYTDDLSAMPNYLSFLNDYGITPLDGIVVASTEDKGSYYENQIYLLPYLTDLDMVAALTQAGTDVLLMPAASAFETPTDGDSSLSVGTVLKSGPHAYLRSLQDGVDSIEKQTGDRQGELSLALYSHRMHSNGNISRLFISGSSLMFTEEYIYQRSYCREFLTAILDELVSDQSVILDIEPSQAVRPGMTAGSEQIGVVLIVTVPLLVLVTGFILLLRRRNQ